MADTKPVSVNTLKVGRYVVIDGVACVIKDIQTSRPGKHGHAKSRIDAVGLVDGQKRVIIRPGHDTIETPLVGKETAQVLSIHGDTANVMDMKSYETFDLKVPDELKGQVKEGSNVSYWIILGDKVMKQVKVAGSG